MRKSSVLGVFVFLVGVMCATLLHAEIFISELTQLDFATLEIPKGGRRYITVPADGSAHRGNGVVLIGTPRRGQYLITGGRDSASISIDVSNVSTGSPAIELGRFRGMYNNARLRFPAVSLPDPGPGGIMLYLGGRLRYTSAVAEGHYEPSFDITVIYE